MTLNEPTLFGVCDRKPGEFYVATLFVPPFWIPLVPKSSWVISEAFAPVQHGSGGYYASTLDSVRIPLSSKSVLLAWFRLAMILLAITCAIAIVVTLVQLALYRQLALLQASLWGLLLLASAAAYWASIQFSGPGPKRIEYLRQVIADDADEHLVTLAQDAERRRASGE